MPFYSSFVGASLHLDDRRIPFITHHSFYEWTAPIMDVCSLQQGSANHSTKLATFTQISDRTSGTVPDGRARGDLRRIFSHIPTSACGKNSLNGEHDGHDFYAPSERLGRQRCRTGKLVIEEFLRIRRKNEEYNFTLRERPRCCIWTPSQLAKSHFRSNH